MKIIKKLSLCSIAFLGLLMSCSLAPCDPVVSNLESDQQLSIEKLNADFKANFIDSINKDLIQKINNFDMNQEVNVIITFSDNSLVSDFNTKNPNFENVSEYAKSKAGLDFVKKLNDKQKGIKNHLLSSNLVKDIKYSYSTILDGIYATTTYSNIENITKLSGVERVMISDTYAAPQAVTNKVKVYSTGIFDSSDVSYTGKGTIVAILDTGCDYTHTAFTTHVTENPLISREDIGNILPTTVASGYSEGLEARDVYYSSKIPYGYDYADKDPDIMPYHSEHGTHVAGIIGGYDSTIKGVAIDTQLAIMKVFSDYKDGADDGDILAGLEDSVLLGVDAINMSLGTSCGFTREVDQDYKNKIYDSIEAAGISLVVAASNDYSSAYGSAFGNTNKTSNPDSATVGAPSTYTGAMSVASINGNMDKYMIANGEQTIFFHESFNQAAKEYNFFEMLGITGNTTASYEYVTVPGVGMTANYMGIDVLGKIALVKRGDISFEEKVQYAAEAGAIACIVYNNVFGDIIMTVGNDVKIPVVSISKDDGILLAKNATGILEFNANNLAGPFMSDFSSWGPTPSLELKPEITAHGGNILSAIPGGGYDKLSGTSMGSPNMCGITILIRQYVKEKYPNLSTTEIRDLVNQLCMSTATIALDQKGNPYSPRKQGAGLASLYNSVNTNAYLYVENSNKSKIELGDDPNRTGAYTFSFHLKNLSNQELKYDLSSLIMTESLSTSDSDYVAEMAYMLSPSVEFDVTGNGRKDNNYCIVDANKDCVITVSMKLSKADKSYLNQNFENGMYVEGYITLSLEEGIDLNIPLLAFFGDWSEAPIFDKSYYEVESEAYDQAIDDDDRIKADYYASTPFGRYYYDYIIPLGSYVYDLDTTKYDAIPAVEEHAAISYYKDSISGIYAVFTGLLRGAKEMQIQIRNTDTNEVVWTETQYNCYKAHYSGLQYPYVSSIDLEMTDALFDNNTHYEVTMSAKLDWKSTENNFNDSFSFSFYVDYEAPILKNAEFKKEYDRVDKIDRYYVDLTVYDNHYVQSVRPISIYTNPITGSKTYTSLSANPIPVYQTDRGSDSVVTIEITDYIDLIYDTNLSEGLTFFIDDYAMNSNIFQVGLPELNDKNLAFTEDILNIKIHDILDLTDYIKISGKEEIVKDYLKNLAWSSTNENVVKVSRGQIEGLSAGNATIRLTSLTTGKNINIVIHVSEEINDDNLDSSLKVDLTKLEFTSYDTLFAFEGDNDFSSIGHTGSINYFDGAASISFYPTEKVQLHYKIRPWNLPESRYKLEWQSSNERVATVDESGIVTAVAEGKTRITLRMEIDGKVSTIAARCSIEVKSEFIIENRILMEYKGHGGEVVIPEDKGIMYIGPFAFSHYLLDNALEVDDENDLDAKKSPIGNDTITSVIIPEGVEEIQKFAFYNCTALKKVVLPSSVTKIMEYGFYNNTSLEEINLENVVVIAARAFYDCERLLEINTMHANTIGDFAFANCKYIQAVDLKELKRAGVSSFLNCARLTTVLLGKWTKLGDNFFENTRISTIEVYGNRLPDYVFKDCKKLQTVVIKGDLVYLGEGAFSNCTSLANISFEGGVELIAPRAFYNCQALKNFTLPSSDIELDDYAFEGAGIINLIFEQDTRLLHMGVSSFHNCGSLRNIYASNSKYYTVNKNVLYDKDMKTIHMVSSGLSLTSYTLPDTVEVIGEGAFLNSGLTSLECSSSSNLKKIEANAFAECANLYNVTLPNHIVEINDFAFYQCNRLKTINLNNVNSLGQYAFTGTGLTEVTLPDNAIIGIGAFYNCSSLKEVTLGANTKIGKSAFQSTPLVTVHMPESGNVEVDASAFYRCTSLKTIDLSKLTGTVGEYAFFYCSSLEEANLENVLRVHEGAFADCVNLKKLLIPKVEYLGEGAFAQYASGSHSAIFTEVNFPETLKYIGVDCFYGCMALEEIDLSYVEQIEMQAFAYCTELKKVTLGEKLTTLAESVFFGCEKLAEINLDYIVIFEAGCLHKTAITHLNISAAKIIESRAFYGMSSVTNVVAPNVEVVEEYGFYGCDHLEELELPSLKQVGANAFYATKIKEFLITNNLSTVDYLSFMGTLELKGFYAYDNTQKVSSKVFDYVVVDKGVLYVELPSGGYVLSAYPYAKDSKEFSVMEGTERIEYYACSGNVYLEKLTLPSTLKTIGNFGFFNTIHLKEVIFKSYYAPTLEGTMTEEVTPTKDTFPKFDELYKYDFYYETAGGILYPLYYQNFIGTVGQVEGVSYVYPTDSEGYDSLLYKTFFDDKLDLEGERITSGNTIGKNAYLFMELCKAIPETVTWKNADVIGDIEFYYNALLQDSSQMANVDSNVLAKYLRAKECLNASKVSRQIERLYDVDNSKYSYDRIKNVYEEFSVLTEAEKVLVDNTATLTEKIADLEKALDEEIDFSKDYSEYKNAFKTEEVPPKKDFPWIILVCSIVGGLALIGFIVVTIVFVRKRKQN
ncbi:MAG: leucine-rich repeat protein [Roseburia sp.]|nr:leucine-rich repeat protein [Anaeroplasma bactoclasticum]MCM1195442.1 leucine-rich repeat protein [Roseburia sp.]